MMGSVFRFPFYYIYSFRPIRICPISQIRSRTVVGPAFPVTGRCPVLLLFGFQPILAVTLFRSPVSVLRLNISVFRLKYASVFFEHSFADGGLIGLPFPWVPPMAIKIYPLQGDQGRCTLPFSGLRSPVSRLFAPCSLLSALCFPPFEHYLISLSRKLPFLDSYHIPVSWQLSHSNA